jgi:prophage regulatory protein
MDNDIPTWRDVPPAGRLLRPSEVVRQTGLSRSQLYAMIAEGRFPPFLKLSERASAMPESWLDAFIARRAAEAIARSMRGQDGEVGNV